MSGGRARRRASAAMLAAALVAAGSLRGPIASARAVPASAVPASAVPASAVPAQTVSATPVQDRYAAPGPFAVRHEPVVDSFGDTPYELFAPIDLGPPDQRHPVVAWGNGTIARPAQYLGLLTHLASWGFIVIASTSDQTGTGEEILASIRRVGRLGDDPASALFHHVDTTRVAVAGHSQGAGGSVRAATAPDSPVTAVLTFELPNQLFTFPPATKDFHPERLRVPVLFFGGSDDALISGPETNRGFFDAVPGAAAMAVLTGADHNAVQHGAGRFPGYATAWLRYQLADDPVAAGAFTGRQPELLGAPGWTHQALKGLRAPAPPVAARPQGAAIQTPPSTSASATTLAPATTVATTTAPVHPTGQLPATGGSTPALLPFAFVLIAAALLRVIPQASSCRSPVLVACRRRELGGFRGSARARE